MVEEVDVCASKWNTCAPHARTSFGQANKHSASDLLRVPHSSLNALWNLLSFLFLFQSRTCFKCALIKCYCYLIKQREVLFLLLRNGNYHQLQGNLPNLENHVCALYGACSNACFRLVRRCLINEMGF